jgi:hypothetical protein
MILYPQTDGADNEIWLFHPVSVPPIPSALETNPLDTKNGIDASTGDKGSGLPQWGGRKKVFGALGLTMALPLLLPILA